MKGLKKIHPEPEVFEISSDSDLEWLAQKHSNSKEDYGDIIRLLIHKVNELIEEVNNIKKDLK